MRSRLCILVMTLALTGCYYPEQPKEYDVGYNFMVVADSIVMQEDMPMHLLIVPEDADTVVAYHGDQVVVAQIEVINEDSLDSVWVKIARDQETQGWIHEGQLLDSVVPDTPISQVLHAFGNSIVIGTVALAVLVLMAWLVRRMRRKPYHIVHIDDIPSFYPLMLCVTLSASAVLYASIQRFVPETWAYFYFHPTLNPFGLPLILSAFLVMVWLMFILLLASIDEILRLLPLSEAVLYTLSLIATLAMLYLVFSVATLYYVGYPLFVVYVVLATRRYVVHHRARYICGNCGTRMHDLGECPKCGTINK